MLALFRRSHELLFIYVFGERSDPALPKFVTKTQNANFKREVCLRDFGGFQVELYVLIFYTYASFSQRVVSEHVELLNLFLW